MAKEKIGTELAREIRKMQNDHDQRAAFCNMHNMKLDEIKHYEISAVLNKVAFKVEKHFGLGYVSPE